MTPTEASAGAKTRAATVRAILIGYSTFTLAYAAGWFLFPREPFAAQTGTETVLLALRWLALPGLFLFAVMQSLFRLLDTPDAEDPFAGKESRRFQVNQRVMTNSIEQLAMFAPLLLALATVVEAEHAFLIPLHVCLWTSGRVLFWIGYHVSLSWRAPGFDWTLGTVSLTAIWLIVEWL